MADYELYCFGESGNSYKVALMLALCGLDWTPRRVASWTARRTAKRSAAM